MSIIKTALFYRTPYFLHNIFKGYEQNCQKLSLVKASLTFLGKKIKDIKRTKHESFGY